MLCLRAGTAIAHAIYCITKLEIRFSDDCLAKRYFAGPTVRNGGVGR